MTHSHILLFGLLVSSLCSCASNQRGANSAPSSSDSCESAGDPDACRASLLEPEGPEDLVELAGTFHVVDGFFAAVNAVGEDGIRGLIGQEVRILSAFRSPFFECDEPTYESVGAVDVETYLSEMNAAALDPAKARAWGLHEGQVSRWRIDGCSTPLFLSSTSTGYVVVAYGEAAGARLVLERDSGQR